MTPGDGADPALGTPFWPARTAYLLVMADNLRVPEHVVSRELDGETLLLDLENGRYFGLDAVGTRFWELLKVHGSRDVVERALLSEFEVDEPALRRDLDELVAALCERGLLEKA